MSQAMTVPAASDAGQILRRMGYTPGKLAMWLFLASDAMGFLGLISAYVILRGSLLGDWVPKGGWPDEPLPHLNPNLTGVMTFILIVSSYTMVRAVDAIAHGRLGGLKLWLGLTIVGGLTFLGLQVYEYHHFIEAGMTMYSHPYAATFYACTGYHGAHVLSGVIYLTCIWIKALRNGYSAENYSAVEIVGLFWHFVDLVWIIIFTIIYLI